MKSSIYRLLAILALIGVVTHANANTVMGDISCKQWMDRQSSPDKGEAYAVWLNGYLSGANAMFGELVGRDFIKGSEAISVANWTDAYCEKFPKAMLQESTNALIKTLKRNMQF
jgi:hypothetical protein